MKQEFEQFIRNTLERRSAPELGFPYDKEKIWETINSKRKKQKIFFLRPVFTHAAAATAGILLAGSCMLFVFRKNEAEHPVKALSVAEQEPSVSLQVPVMKKEKERFPGTTIARRREQASPKILAYRQGTLVKKPAHVTHTEQSVTPQKAIASAEKAPVLNPPPAEKERSTLQAKDKPIMYWADIAPDYACPEEPKAWAKINARIRRINNKKQENPDALPAYVAFIKAF